MLLTGYLTEEEASRAKGEGATVERLPRRRKQWAIELLRLLKMSSSGTWKGCDLATEKSDRWTVGSGPVPKISGHSSNGEIDVIRVVMGDNERFPRALDGEHRSYFSGVSFCSSSDP